LKTLGDLKRIKAPVDPVHEFGAIAYPSLLKGRLFFENGKGHSTPFANVLSTGRKVAVALGIEGDKRMMIEKFLSGFQNPTESVVVKAGS
jgi:UbiD family decarboxylase